MFKLKPEQLKFATALLLLAAASGVLAQQPASPQQTPPKSAITTLSVSSRLTLVDVTVTDSKGKPVHGLAQSDFTVKEDGKPQPLKNFEEYGTERPSIQAALPQLPPDTYTNAQPPAPTTSAVDVILFDDLTTGLTDHLAMAPTNIVLAKTQSMSYLKTMPPGTQVAVLELGNGLHLLQGVTSDRDVLLAAIDSIPYKPVFGATSNTAVPCAAANAQSRAVVDALEQVSAFLSGIEGRKNLIWFTPGTPWLTDYAAYSRSPCLIDYTPELQRDYGLLTAAQVSLYPIDPRGLASGSGVNASVAGPAPLGGRSGSASGSAALYASASSLQGLAAENYSLSDMAKATGGVAYYNRNDLDGALREAVATGADYYALSYVPPLSKYDGKYHTIKVGVDRPGLHLQYREGYTSIDLAKLPAPVVLTPDAKTAPASAAEPLDAMSHGVAPSTQVLFNVRITRATALAKPGDPPVLGQPNPTLKNRPLVRYDLQYVLDGDQVTLVENPSGKRSGAIEFIMTAYDGASTALNTLDETVTYAVTQENVSRFIQRSFQVPLQFDLPTGKIFVRLGVRDVPSEKMGTLEIPVTVSQ